MENIAIYTLFDDNYFDYGITLLYSFFKYNDWFNGDFILVNDDKYCVMSDEKKERLKKMFPTIIFLSIKSEDYAALMEHQKTIVIKESILPCFFKFEIFNNDYDKVLWLDSDIVILGNIIELFRDAVFNGKFCACLDCAATDKMFVKRNKKDYFNGGVYLIDKTIKEKYKYEELKRVAETIDKDTITKSGRAKFNGGCVDQDILNYYIKDEDVLIIPSIIYNVNLSMGTNKEKYKGSKIYHYYCPHFKINSSSDKSGRHSWFYEPWHKMNKEASNKLKELEENGK